MQVAGFQNDDLYAIVSILCMIELNITGKYKGISNHGLPATPTHAHRLNKGKHQEFFYAE
jgi:hypothetical protein